MKDNILEQFIVYNKENFPRQAHKLDSFIPEELIILMKKHHIVLAGGSISCIFSNREINDLDLYPLSQESYKNFKKDLDSKVSSNSEITLICQTSNADTYNYKGVTIQLISRFVNDIPHIDSSNDSVKWYLSKFDFTCCMGAYDFSSNCFILYENFLLDLSMRQLVFNPQSLYPICALYRTFKYKDKGFTLSDAEYIKIAICITQLNINNYFDLKEQLMGVDTLVFETLTTDLIEKHGKDAKIDYDEVIDYINNACENCWNTESEMSSANTKFPF